MKSRQSSATDLQRMKEGFLFVDRNYRDDALARMNTLRKEGHFCDAVLEVEGHSISVHRVVLANASIKLFELFTSAEEMKSVKYYVKLEEVDYQSMLVLVNYAYTSRLECDFSLVRLVYKTAIQLKMNRVAEQCGQYITECLTTQNCLGTHTFANMLKGDDLMGRVAIYIQEHIMDVVKYSPEFPHLPIIPIDIIGTVSPDFYETGQESLCKLVVGWINDEGKGLYLDRLTEDPYILCLTADNKLKDCHEELEDLILNNCDIIKDYKKLCQRKQRKSNKDKNGGKRSPSSPKSNVDAVLTIRPDVYECSLVASTNVGENSFVCLASLNDQLINISIKFRTNKSVCKSENESDKPSATGDHKILKNSLSQGSNSVFVSTNNEKQQCLMTQLSPMNSARCGFGIAVLDGKLIVMGGYDRGECLNTVESYDINTNRWTFLRNMQMSRGRFAAGQIDRKLIACGGSNGSAELNSVELYDTESKSWKNLPDMINHRSSAGISTCEGKLYIIGGLCGSKSLACCEVYDLANNKWNQIADLSTGRSQAAACNIGEESILALGGCDAWNCMNSCEIYDPTLDTWSDLPNMSISRRGASAAFFRNCVYVIGGSDGHVSLSSVEIFDLSTRTWSFGPNLSTPRANMAAIVMEDRLFVVGGFSGKSFLKSIEYLSLDGQEWCCYLPNYVAMSPGIRDSQKKASHSSDGSATSDYASNAKGCHRNKTNHHHHSLNGELLSNSDSEASSCYSSDEFTATGLHK